jgi:flagellar hook-length control protein FliK
MTHSVLAVLTANAALTNPTLKGLNQTPDTLAAGGHVFAHELARVNQAAELKLTPHTLPTVEAPAPAGAGAGAGAKDGPSPRSTSLTNDSAHPDMRMEAQAAVERSVEAKAHSTPVHGIPTEKNARPKMITENQSSDMADSAQLQPTVDTIQNSEISSAIAPINTSAASVSERNALLNQEVQGTFAQGLRVDITSKPERTPLASSILSSIQMGMAMQKAPITETQGFTQAHSSQADHTDTESLLAPTIPRLSQQVLSLTSAEASPSVPAQSPPAAIQSKPIADIATVREKVGTENLTRVEISGLPTPTAGQILSTQAIASTATPAVVQTTLPTPVDNPQWAKHLGQQLINFSMRGEQEIQLHLNPVNLGPMSISLSLNDQQQATAHFISHSGQVRSALEQGMMQLREAMADQGIQLGQTFVGEQRQQHSGQQSAKANPSNILDQLADSDASEPDQVSSLKPSAAPEGQISTYA